MTDEAKAVASVEADEANPVLDAAKAKAVETNKARTGKGTRIKVGQTRGRNPQVISYEVFDEKLPDTLPKTLSEFMELTKVQDEPTIMNYLIDGFNLGSYTTASDPVAEFVDASWPEEIQKGFRIVVRNYAANASVSIEDAVSLIKPAYLASQAKK